MRRAKELTKLHTSRNTTQLWHKSYSDVTFAQKVKDTLQTAIQYVSYGSAKAEDKHYAKAAFLLYRKDFRSIGEIIENGGYNGRVPHNNGVKMAVYIEINEHAPGYGGCVTIEDSMKWGTERPDGDRDIHINYVSPEKNPSIWVPGLVQDFGIGIIKSDNGEVILDKHTPEQEMIVTNDVQPEQFIASICKTHQKVFAEGVSVENQLAKVMTGVPKMVNINDFANMTSLIVKLLEEKCHEKAEMLVTDLSEDRMLKEIEDNNHCPKQSRLAMSFFKSVNERASLETMVLDAEHTITKKH